MPAIGISCVQVVEKNSPAFEAQDKIDRGVHDDFALTDVELAGKLLAVHEKVNTGVLLKQIAAGKT